MRHNQFILITLAGILAVSAFVYMTSIGGTHHNELINIIFLIPPFISVIAGFAAVKAYGADNMHGRSLLLITLGLAAWFVGEAIWAYYEVILHSNPYPSAADIFYILAYPLIFAGVVREILNYKTDISPIRSLVVSFISVILSILVFNISILPAYSNGASFIENAIAVSYGVGDVILIIAVAYVLILTVDFRGGRLFYAWFYIMIGVIFMLLGDLFFTIYTDEYEQAIAQFKRIDLLWIMSYLSFTYGLADIAFMIKDAQSRIRKLLNARP